MNQYSSFDLSLSDLLKLAGNPIKKYTIPMGEDGTMTISKYKGLKNRSQAPYSPEQYLLELLRGQRNR